VSEMKDSGMNESEMDGAIDRALKSYTAGEPEPNLAERITLAADASWRHSRRRKMSADVRAWALAAAASVACIALVTLWMKSEHLEVELVHTDLVQTRAVRPAGASEPAQAPTGEDHNARRRTAKLQQGAMKQRDHVQDAAGNAADGAASQATSRRAARADAKSGADAESELLVAEGVEPIVFKPIKMAPIRMEAPGQEVQ
jgi:hypothetical protein